MSDHTTQPQFLKQSLLTIGIGSIEPSERVDSGLITNEDIASLVDWLTTSEAYQRADSQLLPTQCVDGRSRVDGQQTNGYNAAGGTFSLVMADALSHASYLHSGETAPKHARRIYEQLLVKGLAIGGHDDTFAQAPACGCGAEDKLDNEDVTKPSILRYIATRSDDIRQLLDSLSIYVSDKLHQQIIARSKQLIADGYATSGDSLRQVIIDLAGAKAIATLDGDHQEVVLVINMESETTLDRKKITARCGPHYQAFNLDVLALEAAVKIISLSSDEAQEKFMAGLYYNVATTAVLAGPSLRIVVRK